MQDAREAELLAQAEDGGDMAVGEGAANGDGLVEAGEGDAALEEGADAGDGLGGELGEVGDGLAADGLALAPGLAEEDGRGAVAVGDGLDVEGYGVLHGNRNTAAGTRQESVTHSRTKTYSRGEPIRQS